jgi:hypothetical protein
LFVEQMLTRNQRLFERVRELGGTRYSIGPIEDHTDWARQYGDVGYIYARPLNVQ